MVAQGSPDPPDDLNEELTPPLCSNVEFLQQMDDSEDEIDNYEGYEPLPLGPNEDNDLRAWSSDVMSSDSSDEEEVDEPDGVHMEDEPAADADTPAHILPIETVEREVTREVWTSPREETNIEMNSEKAQEVMSAMANFSLPASSFPEWAHSISEEEWKQQLANRLNNTAQENR